MQRSYWLACLPAVALAKAKAWGLGLEAGALRRMPLIGGASDVLCHFSATALDYLCRKAANSEWLGSCKVTE